MNGRSPISVQNVNMANVAAGPGGCGVYLPKGWPVPLPGTPVLSIKRPLSRLADSSRGAAFELAPPPNILTLPQIPNFPTDPSIYDGVDIAIAKLGGAGVRAQADCIEGELLCITCGLSVVPSNDDIAGAAIFQAGEFTMPAVRGVLVAFGSGNAPQYAEFDWIHGTQLSVGAENVALGAKYLRYTRPWQTVDPTDAVAPTFALRAGFSYGNVGRNSNPARLTEVVQIESNDPEGGATTERFLVPNFATSVTFLPASAEPVEGSDAVATIELIAYGTGYSVPIQVAPLSNAAQYNVENAIPIPNGIQAVDVTNISGGPLIGFLVFGLSL